MNETPGNPSVASLPANLPVKILGPFQKFFKKTVSGSLPLIAAAVVALVWANTASHSYHQIWHTELAVSIGSFHMAKSLVHWIDEALMALFFFSVGLEIKREVIAGELASLKQAALPVAAAVGGMAIPASIYALFNWNTPWAHGWGIPMATDIAFSLAILALLGKRAPVGVKIFLTALAIADDLGAVLVIGLFYTQSVAWQYLLIAVVFLALLALANYVYVQWSLVYALLGICLWFFVLCSGIHATIAGVLVAAFIPASGKYDTRTFIDKVNFYLNQFDCSKACGFTMLENHDHLNTVQDIEFACHQVETPLQRLEHKISGWVSYVILPLFALANAGVVINNIDLGQAATHPVTLGIVLGLVTGKPLGIVLFTFLAVKLLKTSLHHGTTWSHVIGASFLGGVGFTMSLFISGLSFEAPAIMEISKFSIILASILSGTIGILFLFFSHRDKPAEAI